jgi:taurine dioxygenase
MEAPTAVHPVAYRHPDSGATLLYVCEFFTSHIEGLPLDESEALLEELFEHIRRPEHVHEHAWHEGDLIVWDNIAVQHGRPSFRNLDARRTLRRVGVNASGKSPRFSVGLPPIYQRVAPNRR